MNNRIEAIGNYYKEAVLIENPIDLFYLTGYKLSAGQLWIHEGESLLLVDGRYLESCQTKECKALPICFDRAKTWLANRKASQVVFDSSYTVWDRLEMLKQKIDVEFLPKSGIVNRFRQIKDPIEYQKIKNSCALLYEAYIDTKEALKEGITERQLARHFEIYCLKKGASGLSFSPIIAFGEHSALPHHRASDRALKKGDTVLIDIGVVLDEYCSDMTRVTFFGSKDPEIEQLLRLTREARDLAVSLCFQGKALSSIDSEVRKFFDRKGVLPYFVHNLGHGIGLEVHEEPYLRSLSTAVIEPGMIFTIEPGLYLPGRGGVRYEDVIGVTEKGVECFFPDC